MIFSVFYIVLLQSEHIAAIQCVRFRIFSALDHCDAGLDKLAVDGVECFRGVRFASDRVNDLRRDGVIFCDLRFALRLGTEISVTKAAQHRQLMAVVRQTARLGAG